MLVMCAANVIAAQCWYQAFLSKSLKMTSPFLLINSSVTAVDLISAKSSILY